MANNASPTMFSAADNIAMRSGDIVLLLARLSMGWLFLTSGWMKLSNVAGAIGYLTNLGVPSPNLVVWLVLGCELLIGITLILGIAVRYSAVLTVVFLVCATALAHRYWTYPAPQQANQYAHFLKNLALIGGALLLLWSGGGRYSVDARMR
jgi:putative oxidoreductase